MKKNEPSTKQFQRYGIRKFSQGVASVMIASGLFFLGSGAVSADVVAADVPKDTVSQGDTSDDKAETVEKSEVEEISAVTDKKETVDTTVLNKRISEYDGKIQAKAFEDRTEESVQALEVALETARQIALDTTATQAEINKADQNLMMAANNLRKKVVEKTEISAEAVDTTSGKETVAIPAENTEPAAGTNSIPNTGKQDSRNGESLGEARNALRADTDNADFGGSHASIQDDYKISWEGNGAVRDGDPGFSWSPDGKSLIYRYDATKADTFDLTKVLEKLKATPVEEKKDSLREVDGVDKGKGNTNQDGFGKQEIKTGVYAFTHNGKIVDVLDLVTYDNLWGGEPVYRGRTAITSDNGTFNNTYEVSEANGAGKFEIKNVAKKNGSDKAEVYRTQLYLLPSDVSETLKNHNTTKDETTNVMNVYFAGVKLVEAPTTPVIQVVSDSSNNNTPLSTAEKDAIKAAFIAKNTELTLTADDITVSDSGEITVDGQNFQTNPKDNYITRYADIRTDYKVEWTKDRLRDTDLGFSWSEDGKTIIYRYDASLGQKFTLTDVLNVLKATSKNSDVSPELRTVLGTDKSTLEKVDIQTDAGKYSVFKQDGTIVNILDLVQYPQRWGGMTVSDSDKQYSKENTTFSTATVDALNGANGFTIKDVANGKTYRSQLYLLPGDVTGTLRDRSNDPKNESLATDAMNQTTNVINVIFAPVSEKYVVDTEKPVINITYDDTENKTIWITPTEDVTLTDRIKVSDNSGKISSATADGTSNGITISPIVTETDASSDKPAPMAIIGKVAKQDDLKDGDTLSTVTITAKDAAGNETSETVTFKVKTQQTKYNNDLTVKANEVTKVSAFNGELSDDQLSTIKSQLESGDNNALTGKIDTVKQNGDKLVVIYNDGSTAEIAADKFTTNVNTPANKVPVTNPLTDDQKEQIKKNVEAVNPGSTVKVNDDGSVEVTPNGSTTSVTLLPEQVSKDADKSSTDGTIVTPTDKVVVSDKEALTLEELNAIKEKVEAANPGATVTVNPDGSAKVELPDNKGTGVIPATNLVKTADEANQPGAGYNVNKPADKAVTTDPTKPSDDAKKAAEANIKAVNPTAKNVVFDEKGNATVTLEDGTTAVIPASDLFKSEEDATKPNTNNVNKPADKTLVANKEELTEAERRAVETKVRKVNHPNARIFVDAKGNAMVIVDGITSVIPAVDLVKDEKDADKTVVANKNKLTDAEKEAVKEKVEAVNPGATVTVDDKGNATVEINGATKIISAADLVTPKSLNLPAIKELTEDVSKPSETAKAKVISAIKEMNPGAEVVFDSATGAASIRVNGQELVVPAEELFYDAKTPLSVLNVPGKVVVFDVTKPSSADMENARVKIIAANPGAKITFDAKGNATVELPDGTVRVLLAKDLYEQYIPSVTPEQPSNIGNQENSKVIIPTKKVEVEDLSKLTQAQLDAAKATIELVNPGAKVEMAENGDATITLPNGQKFLISAVNLFVKKGEAAPVMPDQPSTPEQPEIPEKSDSYDREDLNGASTSHRGLQSSQQTASRTTQQALPNTGMSSTFPGIAAGISAALAGLGIVASRKKDEE